jgi:hypothetical protein
LNFPVIKDNLSDRNGLENLNKPLSGKAATKEKLGTRNRASSDKSVDYFQHGHVIADVKIATSNI